MRKKLPTHQNLQKHNIPLNKADDFLVDSLDRDRTKATLNTEQTPQQTKDTKNLDTIQVHQLNAPKKTVRGALTLMDLEGKYIAKENKENYILAPAREMIRFIQEIQSNSTIM